MTFQRFRILLLACLIMLALTSCDAVAPVLGVSSPIPATPATATPGGMVMMLLPTEAPATPTAVPGMATAAVLLPAVPEGPEVITCPQPANPAPPSAPAAYNLYATVINQFLSSGGSTAFLTSILETWGAIGEDYGAVTDSYDLTGDGVYEVVVVVSDPFNADVAPRPGQLYVFGCYRDDFRLLYASDYGPGYGMPEILYVGDMNRDLQPDMVFFQQRCQSGSCVQAAQVLSWHVANDGFIALNVDTLGSPDGRFSIQDLDGDEVQEILIQGGGMSSDPSLGPPRSSSTVWDWNGQNYVRALTRLDPPVFRIHAVHDADHALEQGNVDEALDLYEEALDNPRLGTWQVPNEASMLRAYTLYRRMVAYAYDGQDRLALNVHSALMQENQAGLPSYAFAAVGDAFWSAFQSTNNLHEACIAAINAATVNPQSILFLNSYGRANRAYQVTDICPF